MGVIAEIQNDLERGAMKLMAEYNSRLSAEAVKLCGDAAEAEDLVSRTFVKALNNIGTCRCDANLYAWMKAIMTNLRRNDLDRPVVRGTRPVEEEALEQYAGIDERTDEEILRRSDTDALREALDRLEPDYRQAVALYYFNELTLKEIAALMNVSTSSAARRVRIAKQILAAKLKDKFDKGKKPLAVLAAVALAIGAAFGVTKAVEWVRGGDDGESAVVGAAAVADLTGSCADSVVAQREIDVQISQQEEKTNMKAKQVVAVAVGTAALFGVGAGMEVRADENGVVPYYWYTFNGAYASIGANDLSFGVEKPTYVSSEFGSSVVAAEVTGIGKTAESATLTFHYGTTTACADGMVTVENVTNVGVWSGTLPHLIAGKTYYVKATLSNGNDTSVTTAVYDFVQPEVAEEGEESSVPRGYVEMDSLTFDGNEYFMLPLTFWTAGGFGFAMKANVSKRGGIYGPHIVNFGTINGSSFASGKLWAVYRWDGLFFGDIPVSGSHPFTKDKDGNNIYPDAGIGHDIAIDFNVAGDGQNFIDGAIPETSFTVATYCQPAIFIGAYGSSPNDSQYKLNGKVYYVRLYDHGTLKMNLVPCVKLGATEAENVVGFYDTENPDPATAFVANLGTGKVTAGEPVPLVCPALELRDGQFVVTASASDTDRTAVLCWGETYGGIDDDDWACRSEQPVTIPAGATTASFPKPEGWGKTVWFARVKIGEEDDAIWSKTLVAELPAQLGVEKPAYVSSAFGTSEIAANVTGIGKTAESATLTFNYGTTPACADGSVAVTVTDAGEWRGTLPHLIAGQTYYVQATLTNDKGDTPVTSEVRQFVQPKTAEEGLGPLPEGYVQLEKLTSTGKEYVLIDYWKPDNKTSAEVELGEFTSIGESSLFGQAYNGSQYLMTIQQNVFKWYGGGSQVSPDNPIPMDGTKYQIKIDALGTGNGDVMVSNLTTGVAAKLSNTSLAANGSSFAVFSDTEKKHLASYSLYSFQAWKYDQISIDLVPAYKTATGEAGLIDLVTGEFRASATTTAFAQQDFVEFALLELKDDKLVLTVPASESERLAYLCSGATYCGTNGWTTTVEVAVPAGETTVEFDLPDGWGKTVWYARAKVGDGDAAAWSKTLIAADANLPAVSLESANGLGGDTMVVKGTVDSLGGASCTLKVCTGTSEDAITEEWTNLDGGIRTDTGDFTFTLFEGDTTASCYLKPGETYFVRVVATSANGKTAWSSVKSVTMASAAVFGTQSATFSKRVMTVTASMADVGMLGKTMVELWFGEQGGTLVKVAGPVEVTAVGQNFTLTYELPKYETPYTWQLKATNLSAGGTVNQTTEGDQKSQAAPDSATYTWTGKGADSKWTTAANWLDDKGGDCLGYPQTKNATAKFTKDADVEIDLPRSGTTVNVGTLNLNTADITVTFSSENTNDFGVVVSTLNLPGARARWTLDGAYVCNNGGQINMNAGSVIELKNAANLYIGNLYSGNAADTTVVLSGDSWMSVGILYMGRGHSLLQIEDSTFCTRADVYFNWNKPSQDEVRFIGTHPQWLHDTTSGFRANSSDPQNSVNFNFLVPVGGYTTAPIRMLRTNGAVMGNTDEITINVLPESPAARVDATIESVPLIEWAKGINKTWVVEGVLPNELGQDEFVWDDPTSPKALSVKIVGSTHKNRLTVTGEPVEVLGDKISPAYGHLDGEASKTLTAPAGTLTVADGTRRATCTGWKLYDIDPATQEPTGEAVDASEEMSYVWTSENKWQRFAWQWKIESKVNVSADEGGTAASSADWVTEGETVTLTATPADESRCFYKWKGDVPEGRDRDNPLVLTVDQAKNVTAVFGGVRYVSTTGSDEGNDGTTPDTAFATLKKALADIEDGDEVVLASGDYAPAETIELNKAVTVRGKTGNPADVVLKANHSSQFIRLAAAGAGLYGLTVDGNSKSVWADGILLRAENYGTVSNCVLRNANGGGYGSHGAVYLYGTDALLTHCVISNCTTSGSGYGNTYAGLKLESGAKASNCLIVKNTFSAGGNDNVAGVYVNGGSLVNCTVVGNTAKKIGGVRCSSGSVVNCAIVGNVSRDLGDDYANIRKDDDTRFFSCASDVKAIAGTDCRFNADKKAIFARYADGNYAPASGSILRENGQDVDNAPALDLAGNPRIAGEKIDIGAYEADLSKLEVKLNVTPSDAFVPATIVLTAVADGAEGATYEWTFGDGLTRTTSVPTVTNTYSVAGDYTATVKMTKGADTVEDSADLHVIPKIMRVKGDNKNAAFPYDTVDNAASNINQALAVAIADSVIEVEPGTVKEPQHVRVEKAMTIRGRTGNPNDVIVIGGGHGDWNFDLANAGLTFEALTLESNGGSHVLIDQAGGTVSNCVIRGDAFEDACYNHSDLGVVTHCVFSNITLSVNGGGGGLKGVYASDKHGARLSNTLFVKCTAYTTGSYDSRPSGIIDAWGTVEFCTVADCKMTTGHMPHVLFHDLYEATSVTPCGKLRACVFGANKIGNELGLAIVRCKGATIENCVGDFDVDGLSRVASAEEILRRPAKGDWRLRGNSPARDIIPKAELPADLPATDLGGNPRVYGVGLDAGCYECMSGGMMLIVR